MKNSWLAEIENKEVGTKTKCSYLTNLYRFFNEEPDFFLFTKKFYLLPVTERFYHITWNLLSVPY